LFVRKHILPVLFILSLLVSGCSLNTEALGEWMDALSATIEVTEDSTAEESESVITEAVTVVYVIDGDTIWVENDRGERLKIRIIGVDAPETEKQDREGEPFAQEAFEFASQTLSDRIVYLERDVSDTDQYGRLLRYVWLENPSEDDAEAFNQSNFSALLVRGGYARVVAYGEDTRYESRLRDLERLARQDHIGIWEYS